ncbi:preprotein translocase subunit SecE [bacterium]|nr:preprotein translocase subunit SecE [bacterium]
MVSIKTFLKEVHAELLKVSWPSRDELIGSTIIVCILVAVFAAILYSMDTGFAYIIKMLSQ